MLYDSKLQVNLHLQLKEVDENDHKGGFKIQLIGENTLELAQCGVFDTVNICSCTTRQYLVVPLASLQRPLDHLYSCTRNHKDWATQWPLSKIKVRIKARLVMVERHHVSKRNLREGLSVELPLAAVVRQCLTATDALSDWLTLLALTDCQTVTAALLDCLPLLASLSDCQTVTAAMPGCHLASVWRGCCVHCTRFLYSQLHLLLWQILRHQGV